MLLRSLWFAGLFAVATSVAAAPAPIPVFVSIPPQKFFVEAIGGDRVTVQVMLRPGDAPETYEPSPRQVAALGSARLYFLIGVPFEHNWLDAMLDQNPQLTVVDCCGIGAAEDSHQGEHDDPHLWLDPRYAPVIARATADALAAADPDGKDFYASRLRALEAELQALDGETRALLAAPRTRHFVIAHAALHRFAEVYGLEQVALEEGGRSPGPRRLAEIVDVARAFDITTVLVQREHETAAASVLARELGAELVRIDVLGEDYLNGMRAIARAVARATH